MWVQKRPFKKSFQYLELGIDGLEVGETLIGSLAPIVVEVVKRIQRDELEVVLIEASESEDQMGAQKRIDVLHVKVAKRPTIGGPGTEVAHQGLVFTCK